VAKKTSKPLEMKAPKITGKKTKLSGAMKPAKPMSGPKTPKGYKPGKKPHHFVPGAMEEIESHEIG
jgi:hypothetical protein